ncbi:Adenosylcobinamide kinase/adenosylcobinamidephosphate guanylyltransferase [Leptospira interrogans]|nr:Adenosylcobinamide kinase/adenosylcobinamidephosphate guanylyltransferase [Leptospira interrogans]KPA33612.1 Adenosylcobinamide kinase/adenosylcobinamidephosphate guanylyltransferase [Leptospira interrogans]OCC29569.1 Adenosylcobinamide kinase/adenosylcobinamidephosphate guanylyltransferase [Leptospira interrogans serovar Canicola]QIP65917.1 adenosylcobinamide kinase/adenosylcobinamide phosphate guanyltransferase [Leptospira interrogans serovar Copenhageni]SIP92877.1 adenosylcobinamide kinas
MEKKQIQSKNKKMQIPTITLITGGCRSGKSRFALELANDIKGKKYFIATCPTFDEEMNQRILKHKKERNHFIWETIEEEFNFLNLFKSEYFLEKSIIVIDCLSLWINNLLYKSKIEKRKIEEVTIKKSCTKLLQHIRNTKVKHVIFVSSEVGLGLVPGSKAGRIYRDLLGICNQTIAHNADYVYFMSSGIPIKIKGQIKQNQKVKI